jgi:murein DD-endopeptidase MepM/ murein hydrolase activator NlpD
MTESRQGPRLRAVVFAGLVGFILGVAVVLLLLWKFGGREPDFSNPEIAEAPPPVSLPRYSPSEAPEAPAVSPPAPPVPLAPLPPLPPAVLPPLPPAVETGPVAMPKLRLLLPIQGIRRKDLRDSFSEHRGNGLRSHEATDILAPRNTPILAVDDGRVAKLFNSVRGGLTVYQFDPTETYCYYYAHLDRYAPGLKEGDRLRRGQLIGYVGTTGNADPATPHLHFALFRLGAEKQWWRGTPLDPYPLLLEAAPG